MLKLYSVQGVLEYWILDYLQCRVKTLALGFTDGMKPDQYRNSEARLFS
ncbi:hypothetical protein K4A83_19735 [Spirulina subsalsa FACHB-351]|uniref:Restriction endonuclease domain-containing protein n=1 Tax=Spirulina subsalsa FACHB-351 TaxID=234711 RepID=A0ABT3LBI7_9CYAN|nr:hypothetical protein [Spirulina subsalsa]MCW6038487.1 hypothetical protein [Spirulina subsalsa FACHB-351]